MKTKTRLKKDLVVLAAVIGISLLCVAIVITLTSEAPLQALIGLVTGPVENSRKIGQVVTTAIPSIFTGLALSLMFQAGQFNLTPDGIFYFAASLAAYYGINLNLPAGVHPLVGVLLCGAAGALISVVPGILKIKWNANIIVSTLMFNYLLLYAGLFIMRNITRDTSSGNMVSQKIQPTAVLPEIIPKTGIHAGAILAVMAVVACWVFLYKTRRGYELRITGSNMAYAKYTGVSVLGTVIMVQLLGGFLSGVGGAVELYGSYNRFEWLSNPGYGWDGFIVATLAKHNPAFVPLAALFLSYLSVGSSIVVRTCGVPPDVIPTIRGVMIILVAAQNFMAGWKHRQTIKEQTSNLQGGGEAA